MQIMIDIPEKEFGIEINDKFQDFFKKLKAEIEMRLITGTELVCGVIELETVEMFLKAFANATVLPKGHGDLKDVDNLKHAFIAWSMLVQGNFSNANIANIVYNSPTIIKADKKEE